MNKKKTNNGGRQAVVLGGGLAGLASGYELANAGWQVTVIEEQNEVGGLARTITKGNFKFDTGPHRWYTKSDMVNNWMLSLIGNETIRIPRLTRIYFDKKFFYYPIRLSNAMRGMGLFKSIISLFDYIVVRFNQKIVKSPALTLEDGYIAQFGRTLYKTFFQRYSEKLWGRKCTEISADWIGQRSRGFNITTVIKESFIKNKKTVSFVDEFSYPKKGIGRLSQKLADGIIKKGGKVLLNSKVIRIEHDKSAISGVIIKNGDKTGKVVGNQYVSSIALSDLMLFLTPKANQNILKINNKLKYRDEVQVILFINKEKITPDTWIYVHPFEIPFMRLMEMDNWSSELSPKGTTSVVFEIACDEGDNIWRKKDDQLIKLVAESYIGEFKLISKKDIIGGYVHRVTKEYPIYHLGYKDDLIFIKNYLKKYSNLQLIGRNGTFHYNNMDHSIETGLYAAWNIITGENKFNIESVNIEREYLEEKRIETPEDELVEGAK